jgi:hypothetical protein
MTVKYFVVDIRYNIVIDIGNNFSDAEDYILNAVLDAKRNGDLYVSKSDYLIVPKIIEDK